MCIHIYYCPLVDRITDQPTKYQLPSHKKPGSKPQNIMLSRPGECQHHNTITTVIISSRDFTMYLVVILVCEFLPQKFRLYGGGKSKTIHREVDIEDQLFKSENWLDKMWLQSPVSSLTASSTKHACRDGPATIAFSLLTFHYTFKN